MKNRNVRAFSWMGALVIMSLLLTACGTDTSTPTVVPPAATAVVAATNTTGAMVAPTDTTGAMVAATNTTGAMVAPTDTAGAAGDAATATAVPA
ncbi:MAG: hypothetical protein M3Z04_23935, partial [Chloroflexota bacterium]|nr:hypothetical protein [Chloroflexota bacterium]